MTADGYQVLGTLGTGATGTVYLARDTALERDVALKELAPALALDPTFIERFRAEARIMASLDHPNCVKVYDFFEEHGRATLVSEYVRGASLRQVLDHAGYLTPEQSLGVLKGALSGLAYAHGRGLVHRDIKPENLLADGEGVSKLADFGQALVAGGPGAAGGMPAGSPAYMSPEMISGGRVDLRTDIYSLGAVLFEFFTGRVPFTGDNPLAVMRKHQNDPAPDPRSLNGNLPPEVSGLVTRAMAKDPDARQRTAEQFLDELEAAAVAGYGADWEKRSSIKRLVEGAMAAFGLLLLGVGTAAAAGAGATGEAVVGGLSKWLIAGGIVGVAVLVFVVFGLASGLFGGHDKIGVAVATPSPSASPSPSPSDSPSPSPGPSPSPSPSPTPIPTPSPSPSPVRTLLTLSNLNIYYETCTSRQDSTCSGRPVSGSACYSSANPCNLSDSSRNLKVMEAFDYAYASGSSRPITVTITWTANAGPTIDPTTYSYAVTLQPTGTHGPAQGVNYQALVGARPITNSATFSIQYTDDAGSHPIKRGPTFYWN